jgi:hypothetical protein
MFYRKNIYHWEQWSRLVVGIAMAGLAMVFVGGVPGYMIAAMGIGIAVTGVIGWCPACAMIGRRLKERH